MNIDAILEELSYRIDTGIVDLSDAKHFVVLQDLLTENGVNNANEIAEKAMLNFIQLKEKQEYTAAREKELANILKQKINNPETKKPIQVSTALGYGKGHPAYAPALQMLKSRDFSEKDIDLIDAEPEEEIPSSRKKGKAPEPKKLGGAEFASSAEKRKAKPDPTVKPEPKAEKTKAVKKINPNEGQTIAELSSDEMEKIIKTYVSTGEPTPDEMKELTPNYSKMDMAQGYSDADFYSTENVKKLEAQKIKVRKNPYKIDKAFRQTLTTSGFPEKYIKFLERCINTQVKGKKPPVTMLIQQGGAGQIQSQFGEVMAMAFMSIRNPEERKKLSETIKSEILKSNEEFGGKKASAIATTDWVEASEKHSESFDASMDEKYGKGQWRFEGASWDIKSDVESLGLDYKNKGFSTDVMLRVQPLKNGKPNGPARAQKCSLKKDENIFFFNGSINEVNNFSLNFLSEKERARVKAFDAIFTKSNSKNPEDKRQAVEAAKRITGINAAGRAIEALKNMSNELRDKAFQSAPDDVKSAITNVRNFAGNQSKSALNLIKNLKSDIQNADSIIDDAKNIDPDDKDFAKMAYKIAKGCKSSSDIRECIKENLIKNGEDATEDRICKTAVMATKVGEAVGDKQSSARLNKHYDIAVATGNELMSILPESPELMGGLMQKLAEAFPLNTCMSGEEFMLIDGMKVTEKSLQTVFGVNSYAELEQGLKLKKMPNGEVVLIYGAKSKGGGEIPIGIVQSRQKGKGYETSVGFEIKCSDDFAYAISEANLKNGDKSESNAIANKKIGARLKRRNK